MKLAKYILVICFGVLMFAKTSFALPFTITPVSVPSSVPAGTTVTAIYSITNNTGQLRNNIQVVGLPANVTVDTTQGCGANFSLAAGASCNLYLNISGPVDGSFFICLDCGNTCSGIAINIPAGGAPSFVYIVNQVGDPGVVVCTLNSGGSVSNCKAAGLNGLTAPIGITINPAKTRVYVGNANAGSVITCTIAGSGLLTNCAPAAFLDTPWQIAFNNSGTTAYITTNGAIPVVMCTVTASGAFTGCVNAGGNGYNAPDGIVVKNDNSMAWIVNFNGGTSLGCPITALTGLFGTCVVSNGVGGYGLTINSGYTTAYVSTEASNVVLQCTLSGSSFSGCVSNGSFLFNYLTGITLYNSGTQIFVVNQSSNSVTYCSISSTGSLTNCNDTGATLLNTPQGIAVKQ